MSYDGLLRLMSLNGILASGQTTSETFAYDGATNLSARTGPAATYAIDGANRVTSDGSRAFGWDGADRLVQRGSDTFTYDPLGRLASSSVGSPVAHTRSYAYDGDGLLRSRTTGALSTSVLWDTSVAPAPILGAGSDRVVHGLSPLYLARADGSTLTLLRDALGSVRAEVTDQGLIAKAFRYAAYGEIAQATPLGATPTLLGFAGELRDPSGLIYLRARWYDPGTGRFMSKDSYPGLAFRPQSLNLYSYAGGNSTNAIDPTGLWCVGAQGSATGEAGVGALGIARILAIGFAGCTSSGGSSSVALFRQDGARVDLRPPLPMAENWTFGAFAGIAGGPFVSNANDVRDLAGPFETVSLDLGFGPKASVYLAFSRSSGVWVLGASIGAGVGGAVNKLTTNTTLTNALVEVPGLRADQVPTPAGSGK